MLGREPNCLVSEYLSPLVLSEKKTECGDYVMWWRDTNHQESSPAFQVFFTSEKKKKTKQNIKQP